MSQVVDDEGVEAKVDSREQNEDSLADDKEAGERVETMESMLEGFRDELFQLRLLYNSGRMANSWSALKQRSPSSQGPSSSTSSSSSAGYFEKRRKKEQYHQALEESGQDPLRMETLRTALPAAEYREKARERKAKKAVAPASLIGPEAAYRAYKRRLERDMPAFDAAAYRRQTEREAGQQARRRAVRLHGQQPHTQPHGQEGLCLCTGTHQFRYQSWYCFVISLNRKREKSMDNH